jgi:hypothetical protein
LWTKGQTPQWPKEGQKDRQLNGQKKDKRTNTSMAKRRTKGQTTQWPKEGQKDKQLNGPFVLLLAIELSVLLSFFWPLRCLSFCPSFGH